MKYKRCCLERDRAASVADLGARDEQGRLVGRPFIDAIFQGRRVRAVGSEIVFRPLAIGSRTQLPAALAGRAART